MRFSTASALLGLAATSSAQLIPATKPGPAPKVPIGVSKAPFSKVVGRVFEINGKVEYFAGKHPVPCVDGLTETNWLATDSFVSPRNQHVVACTSEQGLRR